MKYFPPLMKIGSLYCIAIRHQDQIHRLRMDVQEEKTVMVADGAYSGFDVLQGINPGAVLLWNIKKLCPIQERSGNGSVECPQKLPSGEAAPRQTAWKVLLWCKNSSIEFQKALQLQKGQDAVFKDLGAEYYNQFNKEKPTIKARIGGVLWYIQTR